MCRMQAVPVANFGCLTMRTCPAQRVQTRVGASLDAPLIDYAMERGMDDRSGLQPIGIIV
jgi:hypothetical protein